MRQRFLLLLVAVLLPVPALARQSSTQHNAVGVVLSLLPGRIPLWEVALRVSLPMGDKTGVDLDAGKYFGLGRLTQGDAPTYRIGSQFKWLHSGRHDNGFAGYLFGGPQVMFFKTIASARRTKLFGASYGYGLDWRAANSTHAGAEFAMGHVGGEPILHLNGFLLGEPKK